MCGITLTTLVRDELVYYHPNLTEEEAVAQEDLRDLFMIMQTFRGRSKCLPKSPETV